MDSLKARDNVLSRIREAAKTKTALPYPEVRNDDDITHPQEDDLAIHFAQNFQTIGGFFHYGANLDETMDALHLLATQKKWINLHCWDKAWQATFKEYDFRPARMGRNLDNADGGITTCEYLIARTGSVLVSSAETSGRSLSIVPNVHIVMANTNQIVWDIKDALGSVRDRYNDELPSMLSIITGPSRTADIEKTLVLGAHGPKEIYVFLTDSLTD